MLGDKNFSGGGDPLQVIACLKFGTTIVAYHVNDPPLYSVVQFIPQGKALTLEKKSAEPKSNFAALDAYIFVQKIANIIRSATLLARGEIKIIDVNLEYLRRN